MDNRTSNEKQFYKRALQRDRSFQRRASRKARKRKEKEKMNEVTKIFGMCCLLAAVVVVTNSLPHQSNLDQPVRAHACCRIPGDDFPAQYMGEFTFTHYAPTGNRTATQSIPRTDKTIAVDPRVIPLHSIVYIEGLGYYVAETRAPLLKVIK